MFDDHVDLVYEYEFPTMKCATTTFDDVRFALDIMPWEVALS
jgi:hypothetical protein